MVGRFKYLGAGGIEGQGGLRVKDLYFIVSGLQG